MINQLRDKLEKNRFDLLQAVNANDTFTFDELSSKNLEVWQNRHRVMVIKSYSSFNHLQAWKEDQLVLSFLYNELSPQYKNNMYLLLVLDWTGERNEEILWKVTEIEKNHRVCRKYVIDSQEDLERVPFLNSTLEILDNSFDFDKEFRTRLLASENGEVIPEQLHKIVELYFQYYDDLDEQRERFNTLHTLEGEKSK